MKKLLALVLALVMTLGLATVGANATSFADDDKIDHEEAVSVMNALNIIGGKQNNMFDPDGNVTRAEMAKMVTIALLGDIEVSAFTGTATDLTDIDGHWAEGYIKYCYSQGIIGGKGNGIFDPNANVTTAEASKMLLVALGYNANVRKYGGDGWTINVARDAQQKGLYEKIANLSSGKAMDRDDAAQLIYNTLNATRVIEGQSVNTETGAVTLTYSDATAQNAGGATKTTLLGKTFDGAKKYGYITGITYDATKKLYTYTLTSQASFNSAVIAAADDGINDAGTTDLKSATDYSELWGQRVVVVYDTTDATNVYGIYSDAAILATATLGQVTDTNGDILNGGGNAGQNKIKLGDTTVTLGGAAFTTTGGVNVYTFCGVNETDGLLNAGAVTSGTLDAMVPYAAATGHTLYTVITAIDNNDDGKADAFVVYPTAWGKVSYASGTTITASNVAYTYSTDNANWSATVVGATAKNYIMPSGVAKGDYIQIPLYGVNGVNREITKISSIQGKVTGSKAAQAQIDGTWYGKNGVTLALNSTYDIWMINNYAIAASTISADANDLALLIASSGASTLNNAKAKLMFPDGSTEVVEVKKVNDTDTAAGSLGDPVTISDLANSAQTLNLVTYSKDSNGVYTLKTLSNSNLAGASSFVYNSVNTYTAKTSSAAAKLTASNYLIADDAEIFVVYDTGGTAKYSAVSGETLKTYTGITAGTAGNLLLKNVNGVNYVFAAVIKTTSTTFGTDKLYGYVTSDPYEAKNGSDTVAVYDIWTAEGALTGVMDTNTTAPAKGDVISFTKNTDGTITRAVIGDTSVEVAITGYSENDNSVSIRKTNGDTIEATTAALASVPILSSTQVLYVNGKTKTGVDGGSIGTAQQLTAGGYYSNAWAVWDATNDKLLCLVVDTTNKWNNVNTRCGFAVNLTTLPVFTETGDWGIDLSDVTVAGVSHGTTAGTYYAVYGETVVTTYTSDGVATGISGTATGTKLTATATASVNNYTAGTAAIKTTPTFTYTGTKAGDVSITAATNAITIVKDTTAATTSMKGGVFTFTWTVYAACNNTPFAVTSTNAAS